MRDVLLGAGEEREAHVEAVVVPGRGVGPGDQVGEVLLAGGGELVDHARPLARGAGRVGGLRDQPAVEQALERGVEGAVGQRAERAERRVEPAAQVVAVGGSLVEQAEDGELEQAGAAGGDHGDLLGGERTAGRAAGTVLTYEPFVRSRR